ncbi:MAG TPA: F0F1 ATP synthase subunit B [Verrucomicrobiae bacterium]|nr:F0F1 ATP synthase subunit B [Verrucomicrobiae bacterium]
MEYIAHLFAAGATQVEAEPSLFSALGIDWRLLALQTIAFLVLLWFLGKFVYPQLVNAIEKREKAIAESAAAAQEAEAKASATQAEVKKLLTEARKEADSIVETAQKEAATIVAEADEKAQKRAERIVADAQAEIARDVEKAKQALRAETTELVVKVTEKVLRQKLDAASDARLVEASLKEAQ